MITKEGLQAAMRNADGDTTAFVPFDRIIMTYENDYTMVEIVSNDAVMARFKTTKLMYKDKLTLGGLRGLYKVTFEV